MWRIYCMQPLYFALISAKPCYSRPCQNVHVYYRKSLDASTDNSTHGRRYDIADHFEASQHAALKNKPFLPKWEQDHALFHGICVETVSLRISGDFLHSDTWPCALHGFGAQSHVVSPVRSLNKEGRWEVYTPDSIRQNLGWIPSKIQGLVLPWENCWAWCTAGHDTLYLVVTRLGWGHFGTLESNVSSIWTKSQVGAAYFLDGIICLGATVLANGHCEGPQKEQVARCNGLRLVMLGTDSTLQCHDAKKHVGCRHEDQD